MSPKEFFKQEVGTFSVPVPQEDIGVLKERFLMFLSEFSRVPCFECAHINILSPYNFPGQNKGPVHRCDFPYVNFITS